MYIHNLDPIIFSFGPIALRWYSLVYLIGFIVAYVILKNAAKKKVIDASIQEIDDFIFWFMIGTIVGARIIYCLVYNPTFYFANPLSILAVWQGGLSFHGGLIGAVVMSYWWTQKKGSVHFYQLADLIVIPAALFLALGRIANFINGELPGHITNPENTPWCVVFPNIDEACRHPSQLYESLKNFLVFGSLLASKHFFKLKEGVLFWLFVTLYAVGRVITDFWRAADPTDPMFGGILLGQWLSIVMAIVGISFIMKICFTSYIKK